MGTPICVVTELGLVMLGVVLTNSQGKGNLNDINIPLP